MNPLSNPRAPARRRRCLLAVLALVLGVATAPGSFAAQKDEAANKIVVSGASGRFASDAIRALLLRGVKLADLVLVTRTPDKLTSFSTNGAQVRLGDFDRPETLEPAFAGGRALLLVSTNSDGDRATQHINAISAARRAGIRHVVYTSFINSTADNPALVVRAHQLTEEALIRSGMQFTILRNQLYMDGLVEEAAEALKSGDLYTNGGKGKWAPVARRDCAEAAAVVLTTPGHEGKIYEITGPELINHEDFAKLISDVTGQRVRAIEVDDATYMARALRAGMSGELIKLQASFGVAMRANALNMRNDTLQLLLGRKPESLRDLLSEHKSHLLPASPQLRTN